MLWRSNFFFFSTGFALAFVVFSMLRIQTNWIDEFVSFFRLFSFSFSLYLVSRIANGLRHEKYGLERSSRVWLKSNPLKCVCCEVLNLLEKCTAAGKNYPDAYIRIMENWKFSVMYCGLRFCKKSKWKKEKITCESEKWSGKKGKPLHIRDSCVRTGSGINVQCVAGNLLL